MRIAMFLIMTLLLSSFLLLPIVEAVPPTALKRFPSAGKSSLEAGRNMTFSWALDKDLLEFLVYHDVTGIVDPLDTLDVYVNDAPLPNGQYLNGKGWGFCDGCSFSAGTYDVSVFAASENAGAIQFYIAFYVVPQPPVDFAGFIPVNSIQSFSEFGVLFPTSSTNYTLVLGGAGDSYDFFIDDRFEATVTGTTTMTVDLGGEFHEFAVDATGAGSEVTWTVEFQGPPKLEVTMVYPQSGGCNVPLNPESGQSTCVAGAVTTPSDGGSPEITYLWTASGGELNSTGGRWVQWTAPSGVANFTLNVEASAPGYTSGSDSLSVQVVPEFPSFLAPLILVLVLGLATIAHRRTRTPAE